MPPDCELRFGGGYAATMPGARGLGKIPTLTLGSMYFGVAFVGLLSSLTSEFMSAGLKTVSLSWPESCLLNAIKSMHDS